MQPFFNFRDGNLNSERIGETSIESVLLILEHKEHNLLSSWGFTEFLTEKVNSAFKSGYVKKLSLTTNQNISIMNSFQISH